ncbi:hypothetical protein J3Q64DRAFT_1704046 [Phycomyces blakesleeanus]|uniref:Uncharacterized protein n=2 Tax=Phycomyces blakesleeanus TaxID=4837 RepID=A0A167LYW1_PHYB8|nr:hypothetical protein PHYBLDRAFT_170740 [Phycomyces blakesleeanus NRRL 1555(-)]OAD71374.1 hypothetical protein PHYBLDRAFT_170740 [Phycomyces blakesleeanus NRRL 1555(-)]|eukprot:XP_018289414.1 hypothetical protein PHYBLDRAFT_170740 [Phycomyces blakesleeanus NRRL 1555(-)]
MPDYPVNVKTLRAYRKDRTPSVEAIKDMMKKLATIEESLSFMSLQLKEICYEQKAPRDPGVISMNDDLNTKKAWGFDMENYLISSHFTASQSKIAVIPHMDSSYRQWYRVYRTTSQPKLVVNDPFLCFWKHLILNMLTSQNKINARF